MSVVEPPPQPRSEERPRLGVRGARVHLQAKAGAKTPSRIPRALHTPGERLPPTNQHDCGETESSVHAVTISPPTTPHDKQLTVNLTKTYTISVHEDHSGTEGKGSVVGVGGGKRMTGAGEDTRSDGGRPKKRIAAVKQGPRPSLRPPPQPRDGALPVSRGGRGGCRGVQRKRATSGRLMGKANSEGGKERVFAQVQGQVGAGSTAGRKALEKLMTERKRQTFLSRKYGGVWLGRVFGRVPPSAARRHHRLQLKRRSFRVWCRLWWSVRREWKLNIRAECHDRYRLWMMVWKNWTQFVAVKRRRKDVNESASSHNERRLVKKAWGGWSEYQRERRERRLLQEAATRWHLTRVLRDGWRRWRQGLQAKRENDVMFTAAVHHWTTRIKTKVWVYWVGQYKEKVILRQKNALAGRHWSVRQEAACWVAWGVYVEHRRGKRHINRVAGERCRVSLLGRHLGVWQERLQWTRQLAAFQQLVTDRGVTAVKRRALVRWRHYIDLVSHEGWLLRTATSHHHTTLKHKALASLRGYSERQNLQATNKSTARRFHVRKMLEWGWRVWLQRCDHCEEIKMLPLTRKARHHFRQCALERFFPGWKAFVVLRRRRKAQLALADQHFQSNALPKCFAALRNYRAIRCYKGEMNGQAQSFRRENLLSLVFYKWWRAYHLGQDLHTLEGVAMLHSEEVVKRASLKLWRERTRIKVQQLHCEHRAVVHHQRRLVSGALCKWRERRQYRLVAARQTARALQHHTDKSTRRVWTAWMAYLGKRRESNERRARGIRRYHTALLNRAWSGWQIYHCRAVKKKEKTVRADSFHSDMLKRHVLWQWRESVEHCQLLRDMARSALQHFQKTARHKYFMLWRERTIESLEIVQRENERVCEMTVALSRAKLARVVWCWREVTSSSVARRIGYERAIVHRHCHLLGRCFTAWHRHHHLALRKMLLSRQCAHFERGRLVSKFYAKWRMELMRAVIIKQKSVQALWHWSQTLQRKALVCWLLYAMNRKRKAERYAQALQRHRSRLLHIGVTQWIQFAASMESKRLESALQHQTQVAKKTTQCVRRCVQRWRKVVRRRRGEIRKHNSMDLVQPSLVGRGKFQSVTQRTAEDVWSSIARKHQIPDIPICQRLPPRPSTTTTTYLKTPSLLQPHPRPDLYPRHRLPLPSTPPVLHRRHQQPCGPCHTTGSLEGGGGGGGGGPPSTTHSFTFLPSTSNESSSKEPVPQQVQPPSTDPDHAHRPPPPPPPHPSLLLPPGPKSLPHTAPKPTGQVVLLPPSAFEGSTASSGHPQLHTLPQDGGAVVTRLADPAVRAHIVRVRDELRLYHELRAKQAVLERQVEHAGKNSDSSLPELQAELSRTAEQIRRTEPYLQETVTQIRKILSENQNQ